MHFRITLALLGSLFGSILSATALEVTHGPMLGRPGATSMGVWARTATAGEFYVRYGTGAGDLDLATAMVTTKLENDCTGWIELKGLKPATRYHFAVVTKGQKNPPPKGTFRTLQSSKSVKDPKLNPKGLFNFSFEFACGNNQSPANGIGYSLPTYTTMLREISDKVDFAILNGDWLYEEKREYPASDWLKQVGAAPEQNPRLVELAPTITGVWENYKLYLSRAPNLAEWHSRVPTYYTFDDHELLNDIWGAGSPGFRNRRAVFRDIGVRAWYDYLGWSNPEPFKQEAHFGRARLTGGSGILVDPEADFTKHDWKQAANLHVHWGTDTAGVHDNALDGVGGDPNAGTYDAVDVLDKHRLRISPPAKKSGVQSYSIGRLSYGKFRVANVEFYLLDTKTFRTKHDTRNPTDPMTTMLGQRQRDWLMKDMEASDADFFFVVSSVNFMIPHIGGGGVFAHNNKDEAWTVFFHEREKLIDFWDGLDKPVFVLTGDLHNSFAIKITDTVWEVASGPHNSVNHTPADEGGRPASGPFKYGPRACDIRWSTFALPDIPRLERLFPVYTVVKVNNVFNNPKNLGEERAVAYPHPQVIFQFYNGWTGDLLYAESIVTKR